MSSSGRPATPPRVVPVRAGRAILAFVTVVALPLTLTACGLLGGGGEDEAPVVIPENVAGDGSASLSPAPSVTPAATTPTGITTDGADLAPVNETVTRTGVVTQRETRTRTATATQTATATVTATRTGTAVTVTRTPSAVTVTETRTETRTETSTRNGNPVTVTVTSTVRATP